MVHVPELLVAFGGGVASILSPCVVPLVPSYLTTLATTSRWPAISEHSASGHAVVWRTLLFITGFSTILVLSGLAATSIGQLLSHYQALIADIGGMVLIVFGLELAGVVRLDWIARDIHLWKYAHPLRPLSPLWMGMIFAAGWTPCVGPLWGSILLLASRAATLWRGSLLLASYALGIGLPFLLFSIFWSRTGRWPRRLLPYLAPMQTIAGIFLALLGFLLATHLYTRLASGG
ncbi:MAG: cytochrome c biogenesis CcdA family protein [Firmicutes bacterium]|nr:cytochrome c biogenesis CcdA family protein [Bacillota bacterium]